MITNEQFMADLERDYPNENWDNVPDPSTLPDIYIVEGTNFSVETEYATIEDAQSQVERCKTWDGVIPESITIRISKPRAGLDKFMMKQLRDEILAGKKVFPMCLP